MALLDGTFFTSISADQKKARAKQQKREELLENTQSGAEILKLHSDLQALADDLDERVEQRLQNNESAFFLAYKGHMHTVRKEFKELRQRADEEETKTRRDEKIKSLEKELDWFMNEALRLDELCKKYKKELDKWKGRAEALEHDRAFLESQIKTAKRSNKSLRGAVEKAQTSAYSALVAGEEGSASPTAATGTELALTGAAETQLAPRALPGSPAGLSSALEDRYQARVKRLQQQLEQEKKRAAKLRAVSDKNFSEPSDLENVFLDCVERVRSGINDRRQNAAVADQRLRQGERAQRKGAGPQPPVPQFHASLDDFTAADRRGVVELLLSSEQVLQFLYDKLFPPATDTTEIPEGDDY
eukprot:TRINITY_DN61046_c0_g1_i1.p1 TRINITY_DN61046_c0_g1~~TRINITY_DN61046_c0_g1_i1.p1  ORF type:complete len:359 (+),score=96.14 TRINITY_DN61046_c0_g1_i1:176-1252(+)